MKILTVSIQKGGCGKTSTAAVLAQAAAAKGKRALAVDLDPQANLTLALGGEAGKGGSYQLLTGEPAAEHIRKTGTGVDLIPAGRGLAAITSSRGSARRLQAALKGIRDQYDLIILDTPSPPGELVYNALQASDGLVIPAEADIYNLQSIYQTVDMARQFQKSNPGLDILGLILTKFDKRSTLSKQMRDTILEQISNMGVPFLGTVRMGIAIKEAAALRTSLYSYAPKSNPAVDYMEIYEAIMGR